MARAQIMLCPYCFRRWSTATAAFRCVSQDRSRCPHEPDEPLGQLLGVDAPLSGRVTTRRGRLGMAFEVKRGEPVRCQCGGPTKSICPECHSDLPQRFTQAPSRSLALIGTKSSGKTHYIAVTLTELERRIAPAFAGSFTTLDDHTRNRIDSELYPRLFQSGQVLDATAGMAGNAQVRRPLVSRVTLGGRASNLVFFDAAGEDLGRVDLMQVEGRYITESDGLVLMLDPLQVPRLRDLLGGRFELPAMTVDAYTQLGTLVGLLREARAIPARKKIDVPIAVAISKLDTLRDVLGESHPIFATQTHAGRYDRERSHDLSQAMRAEAVEWLGPRLDALLREEFETYAFFGVSALGENPRNGVLGNGVAPFRVEDPLLWLLDSWGGVPT